MTTVAATVAKAEDATAAWGTTYAPPPVLRLRVALTGHLGTRRWELPQYEELSRLSLRPVDTTAER